MFRIQSTCQRTSLHILWKFPLFFFCLPPKWILKKKTNYSTPKCYNMNMKRYNNIF